jgi:hypothetical protein
MQGISTLSEADCSMRYVHNVAMIGHDELLAEIRRLRDAGETTNAELAKILGLPSSRIADIFATDRKPRKISLDEGKVLVEAFGLEQPQADAPAPSADNLMPLLDALIPLAPPGRVTDQSLRALSEALSYGLALLGDQISKPASQDAVGVAARAAVARFREIGTA